MNHLILFSVLLVCAQAHNYYFTCSKHDSLYVGEQIMSVGLSYLNPSRHVVVKRGEEVLTNGSSYIVGETLSVTLDDISGEVNGWL